MQTENKMIKVGIVGVSGYSGFTALELLLKHQYVRVTYLSANNTEGKISEIWPKLTGLTDLVCKKFNIDEALLSADFFILAVPHTVAMELVPAFLKAGKKVIDLSGDYRLKNGKDYQKWYGVAHKDHNRLKSSVYGLPELYREKIKKAQFVSNPGCYPTAAILGLAPLFATHSEWFHSVIIDAKSGVSGAGRKATLGFNFCEVNESFKAYKPLIHQHAPEIDLYLTKIAHKPCHVNFVPHLLPITRGILETIYVHMNEKVSLKDIEQIYQRFYKTESFVRICQTGKQPELKNVAYTNFCDIGFALSEDRKLLVITSVIDNLLKGASGQAVQNLNLMYGFKEEEALI